MDLTVGGGLEVLKRLPEQVTPDRLSTGFVIFGMIVFFILVCYAIVQLYHLAVK